MIKDFDVSVDTVVGSLFEKCSHKTLDKASFCSKCKTHPNDLLEITDLSSALEVTNAIYGGVLISKLLNFLTKHGEIRFLKALQQNGHGFCYVLDNSTNNIFCYSKSSKSFAYNICWMSFLLKEYLLGNGMSTSEICGEINESN